MEEEASRICENHQELGQDQSTAIQAGISDLVRMHSRIEAVEKAVTEEMRRLKMEKGEDLRNAITSTEENNESTVDSNLLDGKVVTREETESDVYCSKAELLMKDIPLDQVSDSSLSGRSKRNISGKDLNPASSASTARDIAEQKKTDNFFSESQVEKELGVDKLEISSSRELEKDVYRRKILERLVSDAQKLSSIQTDVEDIKRKADASKRSKKKRKNANLEAVRLQLREAEETTMQLMVINDHLTKDVDGSRSSTDGNGHPAEVEEVVGAGHEKKVREQAKRESEKIGRLQFEVQNIQYILMKMEDEKKMAKGKNRFSRTGTAVLLKDFIHSGRQNSERKLKKGCFCACSKISTEED